MARGAEFVLAPELFLCGYPPRDLLQREDFVEANLAALAETAGKIGAVPLCVGFVERNSERPGRALKNAAAVLQNGKIIWRTAKSLLPTYDVFDEDRYFEPAKKVEPFVFNGRKLGITICEDIWNDEDFWPERLYRRDPVKELDCAGRGNHSEPFRVAVARRQGKDAAGNAPPRGARRKNSARAGQRRRRE